MATPTVPVNFRISPLPQGFKGDPNDLAQAIAALLSLETPVTISFFTSGPTAPTSNEGPFLKDGKTWWVWDDTTGAYVPQALDPISLQYILSQTAPDHNAYQFWIKLDGNGKGQALETYFNGDWHDIYEDTFALYTTTVDMTADINAAIAAALVPYSTAAQVNTLISTAISNVPAGKGVFRVSMASSQNQPIAISDSGTITPTYGTVESDPDGVFSGNQFTAPSNGYYLFFATLQVQGNDNHVTDLYCVLNILKNAGTALVGSVHGSPPTPYQQRTEQCATGPVLLNAGDKVFVTLDYNVVVNATTGITVGGGGPSGAFFGGYQIRSA